MDTKVFVGRGMNCIRGNSGSTVARLPVTGCDTKMKVRVNSYGMPLHGHAGERFCCHAVRHARVHGWTPHSRLWLAR